MIKALHRLFFLRSAVSPYYSFEECIDLREEIKRINAGIIAGVGTGFKYYEHKFFVDGRLNKGLINIQKPSSNFGNNKTSAFIFSVGYVYSFQYQRGPIVSAYLQ